jgi:hypothetical protein
MNSGKEPKIPSFTSVGTYASPKLTIFGARLAHDISSFSRPGELIIWMVSPAARWLQRRFVNESIKAMKRAVQLRDW